MIEHVAVVVPARDEELLVGACLAALAVAAAQVAVPVEVVVALDGCTDGTERIVRAAGASFVRGGWSGAGRTRAAGFAHLLADGIDTDAAWLHRRTMWFASTDADTRVHPEWLARQLAHADAGADAVLGVVDIDDWSEHAPLVPELFRALYAADDEPVHGASLGVRMSAYLAVGGLRPLEVGEDRDLAARLREHPRLRVVAAPDVRATTSARRRSRVTGGFATVLNGLGAAG